MRGNDPTVNSVRITLRGSRNPGHARYDSIIMKRQMCISAGRTFLSDFTWSKNMDNELASGKVLSGSSTAPQGAYNLGAEYSLAIIDTPLRWTNTVSYTLPLGKGQKFLANHRWLDYGVGGWQLNLTDIYQTRVLPAAYQGISLSKSFFTYKRLKTEFRAEALNAFNTPQFVNPNTKFGFTSCGVINSQSNFSRMLQFGVRFAF